MSKVIDQLKEHLHADTKPANEEEPTADLKDAEVAAVSK